jgi:hypothetical protein
MNSGNRNGVKVVLCVIMYFYFLLTPRVYVGSSTKFLVLLQKKGMDFLHERSANKISNSALGVST